MSENLSGPPKSEMNKYSGKFDFSKSFTPNVKLDSQAKTESVDLTSIDKYVNEHGDLIITADISIISPDHTLFFLERQRSVSSKWIRIRGQK